MTSVRFYDFHLRQDDTARGEQILETLHLKLQPYGAGVNHELKQIVVRDHSDEDSRGLVEEKLVECGDDWRHHIGVTGL